MVHGKEKARDMARSLLPSKHRASARDERAGIHRAARRHSRVELALLARDPESFEDLAGFDDGVKGELRLMVCDRRQADKVAPFIRWARAVTRSLPQEHRLDHLRALVPPGLIGEHALFHVSCKREFQHPAKTAHLEALRQRWARRNPPTWLERGEQAELLRALLRAPGGHRALNRFITARRLLGQHDVLPFLADMWGSCARLDRYTSPRGPYAEQANAVNKFLRMFKKHRGDVEATVKELEAESRAYWMSVLGKPSPAHAQWSQWGRQWTRG